MTDNNEARLRWCYRVLAMAPVPFDEFVEGIDRAIEMDRSTYEREEVESAQSVAYNKGESR